MWLTRVRGVPCAGEALGVGELGGGHETCKETSEPVREIFDDDGEVEGVEIDVVYRVPNIPF